MPTYQYVCTACATPLEAVQAFTDPPLHDCPVCGGQLRKVFSSVGVVFKGSGFYRNDSRTPPKGEGGESKPAAKAGEGGGKNGQAGQGGEGGADSRPAKAGADGKSSKDQPAKAATGPTPKSPSAGSAA